MITEFLKAYNKDQLEIVKKSYYSSDVIIREIYMRSVKEVLENYGIDTYSVERIQGMTAMLENYMHLESDISKLKVEK